MASAKEDSMDESTVDVKEEDCERLTPEDVHVKLEDHEERISVFKEEEECKEVTAAIKAEDMNDFSVGLELQKHETEDIFKQEACEESPSSLQPWSTNTGQLAKQENSTELKSELSEYEEKITEENGREGEESPGNVGITSTSQSATSGGSIPSQRSQPTADLGKQPSQTLSVAMRQLLLPEGWRTSLPKEQHIWVSRVLFTRGKDGKPALTSNLRLWWHPPGPCNVYLQPPTSPDTFFQRPFFLWMPYHMWGYKLSCMACSHRLLGAGLYRTVRRVLDSDGWYYMATEYLECRGCRMKVAGWSQDILDQLHHTHRDDFPAILTYRLSCDKKLIGQMRERTLGNGANRLRRYLLEEHTRSWLMRSKKFMFAVTKFITPGVEPPATPPLPPQMIPVPGTKWLLSIYAREVASRLEETKARITSIFGSILKMDSTKKVTKKLAGATAGTAAWLTNVGNEHGQILISVLTAAEGAGLHPMATGLMRRYRDASVSPPLVLYVDRDCCSHRGPCKISLLFNQWDQLVVRLDVWHLMRRFAAGVTMESHPLYSLFMAHLSFCIFEWDQGDVAQLRQAKAGEAGNDPRGSGYGKITLKELARHCRRRTRGVEETGRLIDKMLEAFGDTTDTMGIPLLDRKKIREIWKTQRRHLHCIQDPPGVHLYMQTGRLVKGGITLPVFRCARGSTSLESFHLHLDRFIPGTSPSAAHFQAYLLEGLARWNEDHAAQAVEAADRDMVCYSGQLQHSVNELSDILYHKKLVDDYTRPAKYTGELIGIQYLFSQTGRVLEEVMGRDPDAPDGTDTDDDDDSVDEGFQENEGPVEEPLDNTLFGLKEDFARQPLSYDKSQSCPAIRASQSGPADQETSPGDEAIQRVSHKLNSLGSDTGPGYQHVVNLASSLVKLCHHAYVTQQQVAEIVTLWERLPEGDKAPVRFPPHHQERLVQGRFRRKHSQTSVTPGVESLQRCMVGQAAQMPNISRLVEAVCVELSRIHPEGTTICGVRVNRWAAVMRDYICIQENILTNPVLMAQTRIQLFPLNQRTLAQWHYVRTRELVRRALEMALPLPTSSALASEPAPAVCPRPTDPEQSAAQPLQFHNSPDLSGQVTQQPRGPVDVAPAIIGHPPVPHEAPTTQPLPPPADAAAPPLPPPPAGPSVPRTTAWRQKKKQEADELARQQGIPPKQRKKIKTYICKCCGHPKTKEFGHSQFGGEFFCSTSAGKTIQEWLEEKRTAKQNRAGGDGH